MTDEQPTQPLTDAELMEINYNLNEALNRCGELYLTTDAPKDMRRLLAEVDRLRAENTAQAEQLAAGDASDGYHTHNELYDYRMLYNAHAAMGWLADGFHVVKSWYHSDGQPCFGGGWFVVVAELSTGQVTNHYEAKHWGLFNVPEELPPVYDGHTPADAADRLRRALGLDWGPDEFGDLSSVHVQSIEITNCPDEYCPGWKDSGICPNDYRHRY